MAATATPTTPVRDAPDVPDVRDRTAAAAPAQGTAHTSLGGFDDLFVQPVDPQDDGGSLPTLSDGWRHAGLVQLMARQPRERRETILAGGFAVAAVLWAPLGVVAFMTRNALLFGVLSIAAATLAVVPRPVIGSEAVGEVMRDVGHRLAGHLRSADRIVSAAVRRGLDGLHRDGVRDHSRPSSAR